MRNPLLPSLAAFGLFGVLGCGVSNNDLGELPVRFMWIPKEDHYGNEVFKPGQKGAAEKAKELTLNENVPVEVVYEAPESAVENKTQAAIVRSAKNRHVTGVAVSCDTEEVVTAAIADVVHAGIPVMTFDSDCKNSGRFTHLGINNEAAGALAARMLGAAMAEDPQGNKVATISGVEDAENLRARVESFLGTLRAEFPHLEPLPPVYCGDDEELAAKQVEESFEKHPNLGGVFFVGHWPLHGCKGTDCSGNMKHWNDASLRGTVKTIAFDTLSYELPFVDTGQVSALIGQRYWSWGADSIQMLYDRTFNHTEFAPTKEYDLDIVCHNNLKDILDVPTDSVSSPPQLQPCVIGGREF